MRSKTGREEARRIEKAVREEARRIEKAVGSGGGPAEKREELKHDIMDSVCADLKNLQNNNGESSPLVFVGSDYEVVHGIFGSKVEHALSLMKVNDSSEFLQDLRNDGCGAVQELEKAEISDFMKSEKHRGPDISKADCFGQSAIDLVDDTTTGRATKREEYIFFCRGGFWFRRRKGSGHLAQRITWRKKVGVILLEA